MAKLNRAGMGYNELTGQDDNQINQANEHYMQLRAQARHEGDESHR
jgi:hypothetical protein